PPCPYTTLFRSHGRYVVRETAAARADRGKVGFDAEADQVNIVETGARWQAEGDPRLFKLILSPEFGERVDLDKLTRRLMLQMERDLGRSLEWVAAAHSNAEHPHVHLLLPGVAAGRELRLPRDYVQAGLRGRAEELTTAQLGYRTPADRDEARRREVEQQRFTSLDRALSRQNPP